MSDMTPEKEQALLDPIEIDRLAVTSRAMGTVCDAKGWQTSTARHHRKVADTLEAQAAELTRLRARVDAADKLAEAASLYCYSNAQFSGLVAALSAYEGAGK